MFLGTLKFGLISSFALLSAQSAMAIDDIESLIQESEEEITETFGMPSSQEAAPERVYTLEEHKTLAINALEKGLTLKAKTHLNALKANSSEEQFIRYGEALNLSSLGEFEQALSIFKEFSNGRSEFSDPSQKMALELHFTLANESLEKGNLVNARVHLENISMYTLNREQNAWYKRLSDKLNRQIAINNGIPVGEFGEPFKIALLLPLTGQNQTIGNQMLEAAQLALFKNPNPNILLYPHDTQGTETGAIHAAQRAIADQAHIILGPLTAENTKAVSQYTTSAGIPLFSFTSDITAVKNLTYTMGYTPEQQAEKMAIYAVDNGSKNIAVLAPKDAYGERMSKAFTETLKSYDVSVTDVVFFNPNSPDQTQELKKLAQTAVAEKLLRDERTALEKEYKLLGAAMEDSLLARLEELKTAKAQPIVAFDTLYLPVSAEKLPLIASQLAYYNMDSSYVTLLGTSAWQTPKLYENRAEYIRGAFFPAPSSAMLNQAYKAFEDSYEKKAHPMTVLAYDGILMLSQLYEQTGNNPRFILDMIGQSEGFNLHGGRLRFNGTMPERLLSVYEVRRNASVERVKAPSGFPPALPTPIDPRERSIFRSFGLW